MIKNYIKGYNLLIRSERKKSILFALLLFIASFLEILGIGLVLPVLKMMMGENNILYDLNRDLNLVDEKHLINYVLASFIIIFIIKNIFLLYFKYWQKKFSMEVYQSVARRILRKYMYEEMVIYRLKHSSEFINNIIVTAKRFSGFVLNIFVLIAEVTIGITIVLFLTYHNFYITCISILIISVIGFLYIFLFKKISYKTGSDLEIYSEKQHKTLQEIFSGLKDIKIKNIEEKFIKFFKDSTYKMARSYYIQGLLSEIPKVWLEITFIILFISLLFFYHLSGASLQDNIPSLGLFALASFRLIPCANRIVSTYQVNLHNLSSLEKMEKDLEVEKPIETKDLINATPINFEKQIILKNVTFLYPKTEKEIFKNFSCQIEKNKFNLVRGKSGSGKSTLIDLIMGINKPTQGSVLSDNQNIHTSIRSWQKKISYLSQSVFLLDDTIKNNIIFENENYKDNKLLSEVIKLASLDNFISSLDKGLETIVGEEGTRVSGGQMQRIGIARELFRQSEILIFDESTSALDIKNENEIIRCLKNLSLTKTIIFISHKKEMIDHADNLIDLDKNV